MSEEFVIDDSEKADAAAQYIYANARAKFYVFRQFIRPGMMWNWWTEEVALELQRFYEKFMLGLRPKLALMAPPQHGKSWTAEDFLAWIAGKNPELRSVFSSYSEDLGVRTNSYLQRTLQSDLFKQVFPNTQAGRHDWDMNASRIQYTNDAQGGFYNTTVRGQITGMGFHFGVIDDPHKGSEEVRSPQNRENVFTWMVNDYLPRFDKHSAQLFIMTRWHVDDVLGRLMEVLPDMRVLRYSALAEKDERHRDKGVPLFPEHKPLDFLKEQRKVMTTSAWEAEYQQNPSIIGGGLLPVDKLRVLNMFDRSSIAKSVRYFDKAGTEGGGARTAGTLMHETFNKQYVIEDVIKGQWSALERERRIRSCVEMDSELLQGVHYEVWVEQEPGSGGKESAEATIRNLAGYTCYADKVTGSKEVRAEPFAAQVQGDNVRMLAGSWCRDFVDECETFPTGKFKDQVDSAAGAFIKLASKPGMNWDALAS